MSLLTWNDTLALQHPQMDRTHEEFVDLLGATEAVLRLIGQIKGAKQFVALRPYMGNDNTGPDAIFISVPIVGIEKAAEAVLIVCKA